MSNKQENHLPKHVAIIMDGNRRWAKQRGLPAFAGHKKVAEERIEELIKHADSLGVEYLSMWAFSTENWNRSKLEVAAIMKLFRWAFVDKAKKLLKHNAQIRFIGDLSRFDKDLRKGMEDLMEESNKNTGIIVTFAVNYGGRDELLRAIKKMLGEGVVQDDVDEAMVEQYLDTYGLPDPDLIIRTSGEQRMSGFMPWQAVYAEYYFPETLMPDFDKKAFDLALEEYGKRKRRFGK